MSKVFHGQDLSKLEKLFDSAEFGRMIGKNDEVAVKVHFGEPGNKAFVKPQFLKPIVEKIKKHGGLPFLTDSNVLYHGGRDETVKHLLAAHKHGFTIENTGAPVVIADGIHSRDYVKVAINKKHFKEVFIGSAGHYADAMVVVSHFKGHEVTGFGGAIKNIGMGLGSRAGKQQMHADVKPAVNEKKCTGCGVCEINCPAGAITVVGNADLRSLPPHAVVDLSKCIGCAECIVLCKFDALSIDWSGEPDSVQEKIAEYALGVVAPKKGKIVFFNFLTNISPNCDCYPFNDPPIAPDLGVLASTDPVAIDQASFDLINQAEGRISGPDKFHTLYPGVDSTVQLRYAEEVGLGERRYELIKI